MSNTALRELLRKALVKFAWEILHAQNTTNNIPYDEVLDTTIAALDEIAVWIIGQDEPEQSERNKLREEQRARLLEVIGKE